MKGSGMSPACAVEARAVCVYGLRRSYDEVGGKDGACAAAIHDTMA